MADQNKFEKMLELLINEDKEAAEELFHEIVVEKSRSIYESLLEDEADIEEDADEEVDESEEDDLDEAADEDDEDEEMDEGFDLDEFEVEADDDMGGDPTDDMMADLGMDDEEGEEGDEEEGEEDEGDMEDRVEDLEDALEDLKAEFEKMMSGDDEGDDMDMDMGGDDEEEKEAFAFESDDEEVDEAADEEVEEASEEEVEETKSAKSAGEQMREYVEKVSASMGDNGANTKSPVAGKNDMGGTASNLNQGKDNEAGDHAGLGQLNAKEDNAGNVNKVGNKKGTATKMSPTKGHGAEKKGSGDNGANTTSPVSGLKTRAK